MTDKDGYTRVPHRTVRIPDAEWYAAQDAARQRGETLTEVIRRALRRYASNQPRGKRSLPRRLPPRQMECLADVAAGGDRAMAVWYKYVSQTKSALTDFGLIEYVAGPDGAYGYALTEAGRSMMSEKLQGEQS